MMGERAMASCDRCIFWNRGYFGVTCTSPESHGECRRYPPSTLPQNINKSFWPITNYYQWCGEFQQKRDGQ